MHKTDKKATTTPKTVDDLLATTALTPDQRHALDDAATQLQQVQRRSTAQVFELGEHLDRAFEILGDGIWERWVQMRCGFTARNARLYRAVSRNLGQHRAVLIELAVSATVLGKLGSAEPDHIEKAIRFAKEHGHLKVSDVADIMAGDSDQNSAPEKADPYDVGGLEGLKALIAVKMRDGTRKFIGHCEEIEADVRMALAGKRIVKKEIGHQTFNTARLARRELESLVEFVKPNPAHPGFIWADMIPERTRWRVVADLLHQMGNIDWWPDAKDLRPWLEQQVLPALVWASSKTKNPTWNAADPKAETATAVTAMILPNGQQPAVTQAAAEDDEATRAREYAKAEKRFAPLGDMLGAKISFPKPTSAPAKTSKPSPVAPPPLSDDALGEANSGFTPPAFLRKQRALVEADLPTIEEATRDTGPRMR